MYGYKFVDTNVILRWLLNDHPEMSRQAWELIKKGETREDELYITDVVLGELFYVLRSKQHDNTEIAEIFNDLLERPAFIFDQESRLSLLFDIIGGTKLDFADCYLISRAIFSKQPLKTFDKAMQKAYDKYRR